MLKQRWKFTPRETALLALAATIVIAALALVFQLSRESTVQDQVAARVRRARVASEDAQQSAGLVAPLEAKKRELGGALAKAPPVLVNGSEVTLKLWGWARESGVTLNSFDYLAGAVEMGDITLVTHKYSFSLRGEPQGLHRFAALLTSSAFNPVVEFLGLDHGLGAPDWDMSVQVLVYSQEAGGS